MDGETRKMRQKYIFAFLIFILILNLESCSTITKNSSTQNISRNIARNITRNIASNHKTENCYSKIRDFFKAKKIITENDYSEKLYEFDNDEVETLSYFLKSGGYPESVAKRIAQNYPDDARQIIFSPDGVNALYKAYRGMSLSNIYPLLKRSSVSKGMWGGDYYTENLSIARDYATSKLNLGKGIVLESYIPKSFTNKGVGLIKNSFTMTHEDSLIFIHRIAIIENGKMGPFMSLEEASEKKIVIISNK